MRAANLRPMMKPWLRATES